MTDKLIKLITRAGITSHQDKVLHALVGFVVTLVFGLIFTPALGFLAGVIAGVAKEIRDEYKYGGFDKLDIFATLAGSGLALIFIG